MYRIDPRSCPFVPDFFFTFLLVAGLLGLVACGRSPAPPTEPVALSLLERWDEVEVERPTPPPETPPRAELRFDGTGVAGLEWRALQGVEGLRVEDGRLVGRATSEAPILLLETSEPLGADDQLYSVSVRLRASAGSRLGSHPLVEEGLPVEVVVGRIGDWPLSSPLVAGPEPATYTVELHKVFTFELPVARSGVTRILVRPTDAPGADFALESLRLTFRKEHLSAVPSGPGWHGLGEVYRETLVARAPEVLRFEVDLPESPWLHLAVGSIEAVPPAFRVGVVEQGGESETVAELEAEGPELWHPARVDLGRWAGKRVELRLEAAGDAGTLAFWGAPTVRAAVTLEARPQAVVVFLADTLRRDHLEAWGYGRETAPTLARLAAEGTRFEDVVAQATWTKASVPSILTSLYPSTTGVTDFNDRVASGETTLAEVFREAGYATFATSSVPFSGQLTNLHQGVEVLHEVGALGQREGDFRSKTAEAWVGAYSEWLELHRDVPTFALVHVMDPHSPFRPEPPFDTLWADADSIERFEEQAEQVTPFIKHPLFRRFLAPTQAELEAAGVDASSFVAHEKAWYDGSIRGMDAQLERLLGRLGELGLEERALLVFAADHGEEFLEHGMHWHGLTVYGEVANVPLVFWGQGVPAGRAVEQTVQNLDVMPTLLELAGLPVPERAQGRSLLPLMTGEAGGRPQPAFVEVWSRDSEEDEYARLAVIEDGWKLVWNVDAPEGVAEHELYDHRADPLNLADVAAEHPEVVERLAGQLERWKQWAADQKLDEEALEADLSAEELEQLRSLGYI